MKNFGDVTGRMKIAYVNGCVCQGSIRQHRMYFLVLQGGD